MTRLEKELTEIRLNKKQIQLLKKRAIDKTFNLENLYRNSYGIKDIMELFKGSDVKREVIVEEANKIYEEGQQKKKNKGAGLGAAIMLTTFTLGSYFGMIKPEIEKKQRIEIYSQALLQHADYDESGIVERDEEKKFNIELLKGKDVDPKSIILDYLHFSKESPLLLRHMNGKTISDKEIIQWVKDYNSKLD